MADGQDRDRSGKLFQGISAFSALIGVIIAALGAGAGAVVVREAAPRTETVTVTALGPHQRPVADTEPCNPDPVSHDPGDYEDNNNIQHPYGPLEEGKPYPNGNTETDTDQDWFVVCTSGPQRITARLTLLADVATGCELEETIHDADGRDVGGGPASPANESETASRSYGAPGPGRFFVEVHSAGDLMGCKYSLQVDSDKSFADVVPRS